MNIKIGESINCPNCGEKLLSFQGGGGFECPECGYTGYIRAVLGAGVELIQGGYLDLHLLNELREENDLEPLESLPEQKYEE